MGGGGGGGAPWDNHCIKASIYAHSCSGTSRVRADTRAKSCMDMSRAEIT